MNKCTFIGNITKDAEIEEVGKGKNAVSKARFTLACNERLGKDKEKCNFVPCVLWGKQAEALAEYLTKGKKIAVVGRLDINTVEEGKGRNKTYTTYFSINVNELEFCSYKED